MADHKCLSINTGDIGPASLLTLILELAFLVGFLPLSASDTPMLLTAKLRANFSFKVLLMEKTLFTPLSRPPGDLTTLLPTVTRYYLRSFFLKFFYFLQCSALVLLPHARWRCKAACLVCRCCLGEADDRICGSLGSHLG